MTTPVEISPPRRAGWVRSLFGDRPGIFLLCLLVWTLTNMDQALFGYAIPGILAEWRLPLQTVGTILTVSFTSAAVLVVFAGIAADRWGRETILGLLLASSGLFVGLQGLATSILALTLFRSIGFGLSAGLSPITNALVTESAPPRLRGLAVGILQCGYPLGWLIASLAAAPLLEAYGWRSVCFLAFIVIPLTLPIVWSLRRWATPLSAAAPSRTNDAEGAPDGIRLLFSSPFRRSSLATMACFFMFGGAYAGSAFFFPTFFTQARGYSEADAASLVGLSNGIAVFGYIGAALVGEFILTRRNVFVIWCLGGAAGLAGLLWLSAGPDQDLIWYGLTAAFFFGSQAVIAVLVAEIFPARVRTTAIAVCGSAPLSIGFAVFPMIVPGAVAQLGWSAGLGAVVLPLLIGAGLVTLLLPNRPSGQAIA